jgi:enoyl-CoA hydratase
MHTGFASRENDTMTHAAPKPECFEVTIADHVAHVRLSRPEKLNAMSRAFWSELPVIVRDIDDNARARAIVISSTGKHFSAGMDLDVFAGNGALQASTGKDAHVENEASPSGQGVAEHVFLPG